MVDTDTSINSGSFTLSPISKSDCTSSTTSGDQKSSSDETGISEYFSRNTRSPLATTSQDDSSKNPVDRTAEFTSLKNAIKLINLEAAKAEEVYKAENLLLTKANEQLLKFSRLLEEQDAEIAQTEEELKKERKQRESAEKHFIKLKKMMVVKDVEVSEADQRKKSEINLRKGAEKEMALLRRQLQGKEKELAASQRKYQRECKKREKYENQMMEISKKAGKQSAEEKYQMLQILREKNHDDEVSIYEESMVLSLCGSSKENENSTNSYDKWKQKGAGDTKVASLMEQLNDVNDQLKQTEEELTKANTRLNRERHLREEADKQLITMREKGFAYNIDRRTSARNRAEDCLNTERLKLRNADLQEQYEILKSEAKRTLEKARDRVNEEKAAREAMEEQMVENRHSFEAVLNQEKEEHQKKMEELAKKVKEAQEEILQAKNSTTGTERELEELRQKQADYQQQVIEAKAECKKEQTLRSELQADIEAMEYELDSMERDLANARDELRRAQIAHKQELEERTSLCTTKQEALEKAERMYQELQSQREENEKTIEDLRDRMSQLESEQNQRVEDDKKMGDLRATFAETNLTLLEAKEKIKLLEQELFEAENQRNLLKETHQTDDERVRKLNMELQAAGVRYKVLKESHQEELERRERSADLKIQTLEEELQDATSQRKDLQDKLQKDQQTKEKSEETTFKLTQSVKQLSVELDEAKSRREEAEKQSSELRQKVEMTTTNFQQAMRQAESSEQMLRDQVAALGQELEETKEKCVSLRESLEQVEAQCRQERELRQMAEASLTMDERSLARKQREEIEQEMVNMEANFHALQLTEEKWRNEKQQRENTEEQCRSLKQQREDAEEQCRSLREEIYHLKHEQVMASKQDNYRSDRNVETEDRIIKLQEELKMAESRRHVTKESLDEERKRREELEQQNQSFRDMIPEYAEAEERYQKERRLRSEAEATIETLRSKLMGNKYRGKRGTQDEPTLATNDASVEVRHQVSEMHSELNSVRIECEKAQAALHVAHDKYAKEHNLLEDVQARLRAAYEKYEQEHNLRADVQRQLEILRSHNRATHSRTSGTDDIERKLREKAEKQVMSMRLKIEAKETEIASLKSRLSGASGRSSSTIESRTSSRHRRRRPGADVGEMSPLPPTGRYIKIHDDNDNNIQSQDSQELRSQEEHYLRQQILESLPDYVKNNFGRIGFVKHSAFDYWPALVLDPFTVPLPIRTKWLELYYEFDKRDMFLVYLYGRRHRESVNAYPIVEPHHFISYEEGIERNLDQLPVLIEDKIRYGDQLNEIEEELSDGLTQIRIDARQHPQNRTHPLAERAVSRHVVPGTRSVPSVTSSTSGTSSSELASDSPKRSRAEYSKGV